MCVAVALGRSDAPVVTQRTPTEGAAQVRFAPPAGSTRIVSGGAPEVAICAPSMLGSEPSTVQLTVSEAPAAETVRSKGAAKKPRAGSKTGDGAADIAAAPLAAPGVGVPSTANSDVPCTRP